MAGRRAAFASAVGSFYSSAADRGVLNSSATQSQIGGAVAHEFEERALRLWQVFRGLVDDRSLVTDPDLPGRLKDLVADLLDSNSADLVAAHQRAVDLMGSDARVGSLTQYRDDALRKASSEVDVSVIAARNAASDKAAEAKDTGDVLQLKPNLYGVGVDLKALWKRLFRKGT